MNYHMYYVMIDVLGDLLLMGIAFLFCYLFLQRKREQKEKQIGVGFSSVFHFTNPALRCALLISLILMVSRLISRVIFDLNYGAPQGSADLLGMILYYFGDVASSVIGYLVMFLILSQIHLKDEEAKQLKK